VNRELVKAKLFNTMHMLLEHGDSLRDTRQLEDALPIYRLAGEIAKHLFLHHTKSAEAQRYLFVSHNSIGYVLSEQGDFLEAIHVVNYALSWLNTPYLDASSHDLIAKVMYNKARALAHLCDYKEEIDTYYRLDRLFRHVTASPIRDYVADALSNRVAAYLDLGEKNGALKTCEEIIDRFTDATNPKLQHAVARALIDKAYILYNLDYRADNIIAIYDDVTSRFHDTTDPLIREMLALALRNKIQILKKLDRSKEADAARQQMENVIALIKADRASAVDAPTQDYSEQDNNNGGNDHVVFLDTYRNHQRPQTNDRTPSFERDSSTFQIIQLTNIKEDIAEEAPSIYNPAIVGDTAAQINAAAELLCAVYPAELVEKALKHLAAEAARKTTDRATAEPRSDAPATSAKPVIAKAKRQRSPKSRDGAPDLTATKLRAAYDALKDINLDDPALSEEQRVAWARSVKSTHESLTRRRDLPLRFNDRLRKRAFAIVQRDQRQKGTPTP
jgi:tetratricopeptide (TPR) repeat protein